MYRASIIVDKCRILLLPVQFILVLLQSMEQYICYYSEMFSFWYKSMCLICRVKRFEQTYCLLFKLRILKML